MSKLGSQIPPGIGKLVSVENVSLFAKNEALRASHLVKADIFL